MAIAYIAQTRTVLGTNGLRDRRIVFYHDVENKVTPYITHLEVFNHDGRMYRVHGGYYRAFEDGWINFVERALSLLKEEFHDVSE